MRSKGTAVLSNRAFRNALFSAYGLSAPPPDDLLPRISARSGPNWVHEALLRLAYVQVDSIAAVERAHHHILFTRNGRYRRADLKGALEVERTAFENWTHRAAVPPIDAFPYWKYYFARARTFAPDLVVRYDRLRSREAAAGAAPMELGGAGAGAR
jgi:hypothetical protein